MKKNRSTLKDYFKKGAIPTEANFADLIDSMLNQDEDNISKLPNDPLKITATGVDEALLNFYRVEKNEEKLTWQVKQKPDGKPGLSISDTAASRFFIENGSGNVGIGTTTPKQTLHVQGRISLENGVIQRGGEAITNTSDLGLYSRVDQQWIRIVSTNAPIRFFTDGGVGTKTALSVETDKVEVNSNLQLAGNNDFITRLGMLRMGTTDKSSTSAGKVLGAIGFWGFGVQHGQLSFRAGKGFELVDRSSDEPNLNYEYDAYPYADLKIKNLFTSGNVGIGTTAPIAKLQVVGGAIMPSAGNSEAAGLFFPPDPGGGGGDRAWMRYYARSGESMTFELGTSNDGDDHIALMPSGNVGIGTNTPAAKLDVVGMIKTQKLRLGDKWTISGVGDVEANDDWLRLHRIQEVNIGGVANYYGGFAAGKMWCIKGNFDGSDLNMKEDIETLDHPIEDLLSLRGVQFKWQNEGENGKYQMGLIAQEVEKVFPELVEVGPNGMKGINYNGLIAPLIEAIKQQQMQIGALRTEIQSLKSI